MARLVSLNVGLPKDIRWQGRTVHTGIWKDPVQGPRMVRRLNIDGDGQGDLGGHGGPNRPVFVYQLSSYRYWERQLSRDDLAYGQFGENFTIDGLPDDEVCIGDRFRIGEAIFEVSQPRVTCYRLGMRMQEPRMPALVVAHRRPGFYLRVLEEGPVQAGDEIEKIADGPERMSVADVDGLLYLPGRSRPDLERALRIPALSDGWQGSFRDLLSADDDGPPEHPPPLAWAGLRDLRVTGIHAESDSVVSIEMVAEGDAPALAPLPGQFLTVRLQPDPAGPPILRSYSLSGEPDPGRFRISVKRESHGVASGFIHSGIAVGDTIRAGAPRGSFVLAAGDGPVVLMSAGVGITPVLAMLHVLAAERSTRPVWWVHGARNGAGHPFRREAAHLLDALPDAHRLICYSAPAHGDVTGRDYDIASRLGPEVLARAGVPIDADFYLCGPGPFMEDLTAALAAVGAAAVRVHSETFGPSAAITPGVVGNGAAASPHAPPVPAGTGPLVSFSRSNLSVAFNPSYGSLLEFAEACDVPVRWSCRTGVCHTCATGLVEGGVAYSPEPLEPAAQGEVLICCSRPDGPVVLDL
jgi:ferredoxin-NADP reductase/MOSC domain-containing protein YiiM